MTQPDLFGSMPTSTKPAKSDTPLLLAMDADYVTGPRSCGQCEGTGTTDAMGYEEECPVCDGRGQ